MQNKWQNSTKKWGEGEQNGVKLLWGCYIYMTLYHSNFWVGYGELVGRSLNEIVQEGIQGKLSLLPDSAKYKLSQTITKMVNKGSNNLIAIVL